MWKKKFFTKIYSDRYERNKYFNQLLFKHFNDVFSLLNIGGGGARNLENTKLLKNLKITEIDFAGDNDLTLNLDEISKLPFEDNSFDCVSALDVLEHLENFHLIFDELVRVSKKYIIISLPNSSNLFSNILFNKKRDKNHEGFYTKFYGLPLQKPIDRHRWFLTVADIERFFMQQSMKQNLELTFFSHNYKKFKFKFLSSLIGERLTKELLLPWVWILLKK